MDPRKTLLIGCALMLATLIAFTGKAMISGSEPASTDSLAAIKPAPKAARILVATRALPVGTILTPDSFRFQPWPADIGDAAYFVESPKTDISALNGQVVRTAISAGQPLIQGALVKPGERGFLAAALGPGMRAITVPVSALSGVAGFVFPGDRVDLMLTQKLGEDGQEIHAAETILRNLKVLAIDQRTNALDDKGQQAPQVSSMVTLEVTPRMAEKISVALNIGQLSLALRAITDNGDLERAIASGKLRLPDGVDPRTEQKMLTAFASRPDDTRQTYATGTDVSAFQRRYAGRRGSATSAARADASPPRPATQTTSPPGVRIWRADTVQTVIF